MSDALQAHYLDGLSSAATPVSVSLDAEGRLQATPAVFAPVPLAATRVSARLGKVPRRITLPDGAVIETADNARVDAWLAAQGRGAGLPDRLERSLALALLAATMVAAIVFASVRWGLPWAAAGIARIMPAEVVAFTARGALASLDDFVFSESTLAPARQASLRAQFQALVADAPPAPVAWRLAFRDGGSLGANAFALPDGTVIMTDQLVALARDDAELQAIALHELGHVEHRHAMRQVVLQTGLAALLTAVTGDVNSAGALVVALPGFLMRSAYSRALETEADDYALQAMRERGIAPVHFANLMTRLQRCAGALAGAPAPCEAPAGEATSMPGELAPEWTGWLSTHPSTAERVRRFRDAE